jgi:hypothetical protein
MDGETRKEMDNVALGKERWVWRLRKGLYGLASVVVELSTS